LAQNFCIFGAHFVDKSIFRQFEIYGDICFVPPTTTQHGFNHQYPAGVVMNACCNLKSGRTIGNAEPQILMEVWGRIGIPTGSRAIWANPWWGWCYSWRRWKSETWQHGIPDQKLSKKPLQQRAQILLVRPIKRGQAAAKSKFMECSLLLMYCAILLIFANIFLAKRVSKFIQCWIDYELCGIKFNFRPMSHFALFYVVKNIVKH